MLKLWDKPLHTAALRWGCCLLSGCTPHVDYVRRSDASGPAFRSDAPPGAAFLPSRARSPDRRRSAVRFRRCAFRAICADPAARRGGDAGGPLHRQRGRPAFPPAPDGRCGRSSPGAGPAPGSDRRVGDLRDETAMLADRLGDLEAQARGPAVDIFLQQPLIGAQPARRGVGGAAFVFRGCLSHGARSRPSPWPGVPAPPRCCARPRASSAGRYLRIARHVAAEPHFLAGCRAMRDDSADQFQYSRIERIVQGADGDAVAAGGGHVLHQIVAADGDRSRRRSGATLRAAAGTSTIMPRLGIGRRPLLAASVPRSPSCSMARVSSISRGTVTMGSMTLRRPARRRAGEGAKLDMEDIGPGQRQADAAQAQEGIALPFRRQSRDRLVAAGVERADGDGPSLGPGDQPGIDLKLPLLVRPAGAAGEQEFGAGQPDAVAMRRIDALDDAGFVDIDRHA